MTGSHQAARSPVRRLYVQLDGSSSINNAAAGDQRFGQENDRASNRAHALLLVARR
jgi:hypothetical protein